MDKDKRKKKGAQRTTSGSLYSVVAERRAYYSTCLKAKLDPDQYLSIIIDGMDQSKTNLPHANCLFKVRPEPMSLGAILHRDGRIFSFIDLMRWPHDSNLTLNVLLQIFVVLSEVLETLTPVLFLQMDNCYQESKNRYILGFCSPLVEKEMEASAKDNYKVRLSFLMVGHTHEDFFSRISKRLHMKDWMTLPALVRKTQKAYTPVPNVRVIEFIFDIKGWIKPFLNKNKKSRVPSYLKIL
ncbi:unnamed protein product [Porites lobata]|uniref:DUF7869 domain-containing protein n=1 Tax=Porites lobata TaxID=104759 RepID=A0ABN8Q2Q0_9CNID|nr:unnamed protein product [Porites lobata]